MQNIVKVNCVISTWKWHWTCPIHQTVWSDVDCRRVASWETVETQHLHYTISLINNFLASLCSNGFFFVKLSTPTNTPCFDIRCWYVFKYLIILDSWTCLQKLGKYHQMSNLFHLFWHNRGTKDKNKIIYYYLLY